MAFTTSIKTTNEHDTASTMRFVFLKLYGLLCLALKFTLNLSIINNRLYSRSSWYPLSFIFIFVAMLLFAGLVHANSYITTNNILSFSLDKQNIVTDDLVKLTATISKSPELYEFEFWTRAPQGSWDVVKNYSTTNSINWTPTWSGNWRLVVHVRKIGSSNLYDFYAYIDVIVNEKLINQYQIKLNIPATTQIPRNSEGAFVSLSDKILFLYTQFYQQSSADQGKARIVGIESYDLGNTWTWPPMVYVESNASLNIMSVSLLKLHSGRILLFYLKKNNWQDCRPWLKYSDDDGYSWSDEELVIKAPGYFVLNNDRVVQLDSGRIILPVAFHRAKNTDPTDAKSFDYRGISMWFFSDDNGTTWSESASWWGIPVQSDSGLQEPGVVELYDGTLYSWARTDQKSQYQFKSVNEGETWSAPVPSPIVSPKSPASIKAFSDILYGDLIAAYNDHSDDFPNHSTGRSPLVVAISQNNGNSWEKKKILEESSSRDYSYTAIHCIAEDYTCLFAYSETTNNMWSLRIRKIDIDFLYK